MLPAHPPFPTASSLPFQPEPAAPEPCAEAGIHTSTLISESLDGLSVAAMRQNDGRSANGFAPRPRAGAGGVKPPGATVCAIVIVVFGRFSAARLSHPAACASDAAGS